MIALVAAAVNAACGAKPIQSDADASTPPTPDAASICPSLDLAPEPMQGSSPFGDLDLEVVFFGVGDCIDISRADLVLEGAAGDRLAVNFSYPVGVDSDGRRFVAADFDADAGFRYTPATGPEGDEETFAISIDVTRWQERARIPHDIDITLSITDPAFAVEPVPVTGAFCKWVSLLCADQD